MKNSSESAASVIPIQRGREIKVERAEQAVQEVGQLVHRMEMMTHEMSEAFGEVEELIQKEFKREGGPRGEMLAHLDREYVGWVGRLLRLGGMLVEGQAHQRVRDNLLTGEREYLKNEAILEDVRRVLARMNSEYASKEEDV